MAADVYSTCSLARRGSFAFDFGGRLGRRSGKELTVWLVRSDLRCTRCAGCLGGRLGR